MGFIDLPVEWWGSAVAVVYLVACWFLGDTYLFSNYQLYAGAGTREEGAVPELRRGDEVVRFIDYVDFHGFEPQQITADGQPCSVIWMVEESHRWVAEHLADDPPADSVPLIWGFRRVRVTDEGQIAETFVQKAAGTARPR